MAMHLVMNRFESVRNCILKEAQANGDPIDHLRVHLSPFAQFGIWQRFNSSVLIKIE
jgi:hypothetical protein